MNEKLAFYFIYFLLRKRSKQRIDARNTWTRSDFCADE